MRYPLMPQTRTLVIPHLLNDDIVAIWRAAADAGWDVARVGGFTIDPGLAVRDLCVFGPLSFGDDMRAALRMALIEPTDDWLGGLPWPFLKRRITFMQLAEARRLSVPAFIKPPREKSFPSRVYASGRDVAVPASFGDHRVVLVAEPVTFGWEVRLFVLEHTIAASSPYSYRGERPRIPCPRETLASALRFGRALLDTPEIPLPPAVVIDVGFIEGRGWAVVEANAAWASALYLASPSQVLPVLMRASASFGSSSENAR
jgi:hypothetical protein